MLHRRTDPRAGDRTRCGPVGLPRSHAHRTPAQDRPIAPRFTVRSHRPIGPAHRFHFARPRAVVCASAYPGAHVRTAPRTDPR